MIIEIGILRDVVTVALDCCGAGLSRRGYRTYNVAAPIAETLGAAMLLLSHYRGDRPLIDPMCGSGTMPIEAAMIANNMAPGHLQRRNGNLPAAKACLTGRGRRPVKAA